ncbi:MAG: substrate-binding domain-containing protein [Lentisphaeria bacterium]|nr:substrate-binding domain-containing protein [Lentisphaeria bacterium]
MPERLFANPPPTVLTRLIRHKNDLFLEGVIEQADVYGWHLREMDMTYGIIPAVSNLIGAIITDLPDSELASQLCALTIPVVRMGNLPHPLDIQLPAILPDLKAAGNLAADYFADREFKHLGYIGHIPWSHGKHLYLGLKERAATRGCKCHWLRLKNTDDRLNAKKYQEKWQRYQTQITAWLSRLPKPLGLFVYSDGMAANICEWCVEAGLSVPEDIAILGYGNNRFTCRAAPVTLSSIATNNKEIGHQSICMLKELIDGKPGPYQPVFVPPKGVVERQSTNLVAVNHPLLRKALAFIWERYDDPTVRVDTIVASIGASRRSLERLFNKHLSRNVAEELRRRRLEICRELLRGTSLPVEKIAGKTGFSSASYLQTCFKKTFGLTPGAYRRQHADQAPK